MIKIYETVGLSGYKVWMILSGDESENILCTCDNKESAEFIMEALTALDQLGKGYFT
jgi:hypothetical protein